MTLGTTIILLVLGVASVYFGMALVANRPHATGDVERRSVSAFVLLMFALALAIRTDQFGVDTITYLRIYDQYCFSSIDDLEFSYKVSFGLIDAVQLGACSSALLKTTWVFLIVCCFLLLPGPLAERLKLGALGLFSFIGTELATNALRQGLSAAVLMLAFAWYGRNRAVGLLLAVFAVLLHSSSALAIIAVAIAFLRFRYFAVAFAILLAFLLSYSYLGLQVAALDRLTYEIYKYSLHDASEVYIRILAAAQLVVPIAVAFVTRGRAKDDDPAERAGDIMAMKIALTALPYLTLPYFGYRYIYGIYLIVLYCSRSAVLDDRRPAFEMVLAANVLIALAWALGASSVGQIPLVAL